MSFWTIASGEENNNQIIGLMQKLQNDSGCANLEFASKYISKILCKKLYFV